MFAAETSRQRSGELQKQKIGLITDKIRRARAYTLLAKIQLKRIEINYLSMLRMRVHERRVRDVRMQVACWSCSIQFNQIESHKRLIYFLCIKICESTRFASSLSVARLAQVTWKIEVERQTIFLLDRYNGKVCERIVLVLLKSLRWNAIRFENEFLYSMQ